MKATAIRTNYFPRPRVQTYRFPNAADRRITAEKVVDTLLAAGIVLGVVSVLLFILAIG